MESIWNDVKMPQFSRLDGEIHTDVLIIGGGAAGILTATLLRRCGVDCVLVEKGRICSGVTANTTAKITAQHGFIYQKIFRKSGAEAAHKYLRANTEALQKYEELCAGIDCDFERKDNYVYTLNDRQKAEREIEVLRKIGFAAEFCDKTPLKFPVAGAVKFADQAQFHPLKFFSAMAKELTIYENSFVREMIGNTAVTDHGKIHAKTVVVATHFPLINKHGSYFIKLYQFRSYVIALRDAQDVEGMYVDEAEGGLSFRNYGDLLLLGGGGGHTGKPCGGWDVLRRFAKDNYPDAKEVKAWATQDCMSLDSIPYIGHYSARTNNLYVASGFCKWGMTGSMVAATMLCDAILGRQNDLADIFDPSRSVMHPQLAKNGWNAVTNLLSISSKRCPHLGCALKWNSAEHSWDCPCHGSRFSREGELLDNPANGDLNK